MSDAENRKAINTNTKSIKELTKKFAEFAGSKGKDSKEDKEEKELTGIKAVDKKIEDVKDAFSNNTTIKFFKDIQKNTKATVKSLEVFTTVEGRRERAITEAIGEGALADELQTKEMKEMREPLTNLTLITIDAPVRITPPTAP